MELDLSLGAEWRCLLWGFGVQDGTGVRDYDRGNPKVAFLQAIQTRLATLSGHAVYLAVSHHGACDVMQATCICSIILQVPVLVMNVVHTYCIARSISSTASKPGACVRLPPCSACRSCHCRPLFPYSPTLPNVVYVHAVMVEHTIVLFSAHDASVAGIQPHLCTH